MQESFKKAMSRFATGVCVVTFTNSETQRFAGITISAFSSLSISPLKTLFCLGNEGANSAAFANADRFVVNILSSEQTALAYQFAGSDYTQAEPFMTDIDGLPCIRDTLATVVCDKGNVHTEGDHDIIIGDVNQIVLGDEELQPLLYYKSKIIEDYQHVQ